MNLSERQRTVEVELDPAQGPYIILATAWGPGIEGEFYLTAHSPGKLTLTPFATEKPTATEAALMAAVVFPTSCPTCNKAVVGWERKSNKGLQFHEKCYKCADCGTVSF